MRRSLQAVELKVNGGAERGQRGHEPFVSGNAHAVRVDHDVRDPAGLRRGDEFQDARMDRRLAAAELHDFRVTLQCHQPIEHCLHIGQCQIEALPGVGEADRVLQIAAGVDLDQRHADVLFVLRAEPTVPGTAVVHIGAPTKVDAAGFVEPRRGDIRLGVGADRCLEPTVLPASLAKVDAVLAQQDLCVDRSLANRANAAP
jgi:hypothetical protein